jgi:histidinol phosphatase-like PHP family hydrolase
VKLALKHKADLVLNTDAHAPEDLIDKMKRQIFLTFLGIGGKNIDNIIHNSRNLAMRRKL